jgi:hypothetical protein
MANRKAVARGIDAERADMDFNVTAAARGQSVFSVKANRAGCHQPPLWTEIKIDSFFCA